MVYCYSIAIKFPRLYVSVDYYLLQILKMCTSFRSPCAWLAETINRARYHILKCIISFSFFFLSSLLFVSIIFLHLFLNQFLIIDMEQYPERPTASSRRNPSRSSNAGLEYPFSTISYLAAQCLSTSLPLPLTPSLPSFYFSGFFDIALHLDNIAILQNDVNHNYISCVHGIQKKKEKEKEKERKKGDE